MGSDLLKLFEHMFIKIIYKQIDDVNKQAVKKFQNYYLFM